MAVEIVVDQVESGETASGTRYTYTIDTPGQPDVVNPYEPSAGEFELLQVAQGEDGAEQATLIAWSPESD